MSSLRLAKAESSSSFCLWRRASCAGVVEILLECLGEGPVFGMGTGVRCWTDGDAMGVTGGLKVSIEVVVPMVSGEGDGGIEDVLETSEA